MLKIFFPYVIDSVYFSLFLSNFVKVTKINLPLPSKGKAKILCDLFPVFRIHIRQNFRHTVELVDSINYPSYPMDKP